MNIFSNKTAIIFDFDGTIADTYHLHDAAFQAALKDYSLNYSYDALAGMSTREAMKKIFDENSVPIETPDMEELVRAKQKNAHNLFKEAIDFIPGAYSFINLVYQKGFPLYLASSGSAGNVLTGLKSLQIEHYFRHIVTSEQVSRAKPDPEIFQSILSRFSIKQQNAIIIEDAVSGIQAANRAGIDVVCVNKKIPSDNNVDLQFVSKDFFELAELLNK